VYTRAVHTSAVETDARRAAVARGCSTALLLTWLLGPGLAVADRGPAPVEVLADPPSDLSVTVYRAPSRPSGSIDLDALQGFALISETRTVHLPAGESRLRFEGVADGIEPASTIVTGLERGIMEKNRDAALLSPSALVAATVGKPVLLTRANRKTGRAERLAGEILSDAGGGVVFKTVQGIEALRCSGLPETLSFEPVTGLASRPTLSVRVRSAEAMTARVTLSYLTRGFDWAADYTATVSGDGKSMELGAWVTLANGNGVGFPAARTQVVAGRLNREDEEVEPIDLGGPIIALCWPRGSTSDVAAVLQINSPPADMDRKFAPVFAAAVSMKAGLREVSVTAMRVTQEQLGDLKLYRVPERTTIASRQSKQVRLLDRTGIPVSRVYRADLDAEERSVSGRPARLLLRTKNDDASHLGLPLPSGNVSVMALRGAEPLMIGQSDIHDLAVDEDVEIKLGESPEVRVTVSSTGDVRQVDVSNARSMAIDFELGLQLPDGARLVGSTPAAASRNGRPVLRLKIAANSTATLRYRLERLRQR